MQRVTGIFLALLFVVLPAQAAEPLKVGYFAVDASPPIGSPLAYNLTAEVEHPLRCSGVVLLTTEGPIVLCAVDWIGIANEGFRYFREELARAAKTTPERVAVHALHQHDAPRCDFTAEQIARESGVNDLAFDSAFSREVIRNAALAVEEAVKSAQPVTHIGIGEGIVEKVASNRRILGPDGKVKSVRYTATKDPALRAVPEGVIDRKLKSISFWNGDERLVELTYYATHPQSYYRTGKANPDFPGIARDQRQRQTGVPHVHFNGAGGNIGAGKYNDGSPENRMVLASRVATGMEQAWDQTRRFPLSSDEVSWKSIPVSLPVAKHLNQEQLLSVIQDPKRSGLQRCDAAVELAWLRRCQAGDTIDVSCLSLGSVRILHMPGELFVEYQLAAQDLRPDLFVAMAAYGEYAPGYIGTEIAYHQGGYETTPGASLVSPEVEDVLMSALANLLDGKPKTTKLGVEAAEREAQAAAN